jgi:hypothetical protein
MDADLIRQQSAQNALDAEPYMRFVVFILGKICAPSRDPEVACIASAKDMTTFFMETHRVLRLMKVDMANFHIQSLRPQLRQVRPSGNVVRSILHNPLLLSLVSPVSHEY